jgi:hypothetical protein
VSRLWDDLQTAVQAHEIYDATIENQLAASQVEVERLETEVADLTARLAECEDGDEPPPPEPGVLGPAFGSSRVGYLPPVVTAVDATRIYYSGSPGQYDWTTKDEITHGLEMGSRLFVVSVKSTDAEALRTFLAGKPAGVTVLVTYEHEHEADLRKGGLTKEQYDAGTVAVAAVTREFGPDVLYGPIHNGNNPKPGGGWEVGGWVEASSANEDYEFWGSDCYCPDSQDPFERFAPMVAEAQRRGLPLVIGETGAPAGTQQAAWAERLREWTLQNGVVTCYWHSQTSSTSTDWRLSESAARAFFGL